MPTYKAPLRDMKFAYFELFDGESLSRLPGLDEATPDLLLSVCEELGRIATDVLQPLNASGDREGTELAGGKVTTPKGFPAAWKLLREGGWMGLTAHADHGGQGLPHTIGNMTAEILQGANLSFSMYYALSHGAYTALDKHATDELKARFMPKLASGEWSGTMCLTEPQCGTDLGMVRMRAESFDGAPEGTYKLTGNKIFISAGDHDMAENIVHLVLARLPGAPAGIKGISLFVIPKLREENGKLVDNGVVCTGLEHKMGIKGSATCSLSFENSVGHLVGQPHRGMPAMFTFMNGARLHVGVSGMALAEAAGQGAVAFARERLQGRSLTGAKFPQQPADPILVHPDVRRMLLSVRAFTEAARALVAWTSIELDHHEFASDPARAEAADDFASVMTPVIKAFLTDLGFEACNTALQVYGGYGYCTDYGVEQLVRDCRITQIYEGTNGIQALDLVGRKLPAHMGRYLRRFFHPVAAFLEAESSTAELQEFVEPAAKAFDRLQRASAFLAQEGLKNPDEAGAASVDYLHLFGWTAFAFLWAKTAKVALAKLAQGVTGEEKAFYEAKLATARFFVARLLPRHSAHFAQLLAGSKSLMAFPDEAF
jgi:alkylation response protein AidB-like acyl-CoA dehydrogenase